MSISPLDVGCGAALAYTDATRGFAPIPAAERALPTVTAEPYFQVSTEPVAVEGPAFERNGNLVFVDVHGGRILRLSGRTLTTLHSDPALRPAGIAIHKDGRIFAACLGDLNAGTVIALAPDGTRLQTIVPAAAGYVPDDLVFDRDGGFYFTDFRGASTQAAGGVYYVSPGFETITPILPRMCAANGVALSPDGSVLWATEFSGGRLHRASLAGVAKLAPVAASTVPYHFVGPAPDSMRADADGNVYVALFNQGRVLAFSPYGIPIGQILLPGREDNQFLKSTSLAFVPGSRDVVIVAKDEGGRGSMIFKAQALAAGVALFSHQ